MNNERINNKSLEGEIEVLLAEPKDAYAIQSLLLKTWLDTYPNEEYKITAEDIEERYKDSLSEAEIKRRKVLLENMGSHEQVYVAKYDGKVVGVCRVVRKEEANQLQMIYVLPEFQGKGVGKSLWIEAQKFIDPGKDTIVDVVEYNQKAIDFYNKLGFVDTGKRFTDERFRMKNGSLLPEMELILKSKAPNKDNE